MLQAGIRFRQLTPCCIRADTRASSLKMSDVPSNWPGTRAKRWPSAMLNTLAMQTSIRWHAPITTTRSPTARWPLCRPTWIIVTITVWPTTIMPRWTIMGILDAGLAVVLLPCWRLNQDCKGRGLDKFGWSKPIWETLCGTCLGVVGLSVVYFDFVKKTVLKNHLLRHSSIRENAYSRFLYWLLLMSTGLPILLRPLQPWHLHFEQNLKDCVGFLHDCKLRSFWQLMPCCNSHRGCLRSVFYGLGVLIHLLVWAVFLVGVTDLWISREVFHSKFVSFSNRDFNLTAKEQCFVDCSCWHCDCFWWCLIEVINDEWHFVGQCLMSHFRVTWQVVVQCLRLLLWCVEYRSILGEKLVFVG